MGTPSRSSSPAGAPESWTVSEGMRKTRRSSSRRASARALGAASAGPQAFARVLTGFGYHGPDGQIIADHDFGTVSVVGRAPLVLDYQIAENAVYSDGVPVTCDDLVLAWAAQSGRFPDFDAASRAGAHAPGDRQCSTPPRQFTSAHSASWAMKSENRGYAPVSIASSRAGGRGAAQAPGAGSASGVA